MMQDKVIRDGKVAVVISPDFGAGWSTWANESQQEWCRHAPELVEAVERGGTPTKIRELVDATFGVGEGPYMASNISSLVIEWVPVGAPYYIHEYDGSERIVTEFLTA